MPISMASQPIACASCMEDTSHPIHIINDASLCAECFEPFRGQFEEALRNESAYPVRWGGEVVDIEHFSYKFSFNFLRQWRVKEAEYKTPVKDRLYCLQNTYVVPEDSGEVRKEQCGIFLGVKVPDGGIVKCTSGHYIHAGCGEPARDLTQHRCPPVEEDAFKGLIRGKDFQICPNEACALKLELRDGCNMIVCSLCGTRLCFLCGARVVNGHFGPGMPCPRFGRPGANAIHDGPAMFGHNNPLPNPFDMTAEDAWNFLLAADNIFGMNDQGRRALTRAERDRVHAIRDGENQVLADIARIREAREAREATPQGALQALHEAQLDQMHEQILDEPPTRENERLHDLIHQLESQLPLYTWGMVPQEMGDWRNLLRNRRAHERMQELSGQIREEDFVGWEQLRDIANTFMAVWDRTHVW